MRLIAVTLTLFFALAGLTGCENVGKRFIFGPNAIPTPNPPTPAGVQTAESLIEYLNENSRRINSLRCTDIEVTTRYGLQTINLRGKMMAMKSRNMIMSISMGGTPMMDFGTNDQEFWIWSSKMTPPHQFYCTYKDFEGGKLAEFPFPFQPGWIMDALSMGQYGPASKYTIDSDASTVKLVEKTTTPSGQPVRKIIVFNRRKVDAPMPQVMAYQLIDDATGKEMVSANIQAVAVDHTTGAVVPKRLELRVPSQNMNIGLALTNMQVNPPLDAGSFQRQSLQGVQSIDLARGR